MALQWDDLNFKTGVLNVNKQVYDVRGQLQISTPKTKNSVRKIVLPPAVVAVLRGYKKTVDSRWMFPSPVKKDCPITPGVVRRRLQLILEHAGCKHVRFHDLRHTFATLALENDMDVKTLSAMLGHVSAATTLDIYTHITDDMRLTAAANIDRGIGKAAPQEGLSELGQLPQPRRKSREWPTSSPTWAASAGPVPAASARSTTIFSRDAIPPNGPTAQCLRPYPRGARGEAEGADRGDESGHCGSEEADGFR